MEIIPSILSDNPTEVKETIKYLEAFGILRAQIDINDGTFLGEMTITPAALSGFSVELFLDYHLMTNNPLLLLEKCQKAGGERIIGQIEQIADQQAYVDRAQKLNLKPGLAIDINTSVKTINLEIIKDLAVLLLMDYPAGIGGQKFDFRVISKIESLYELRAQTGSGFEIICDGGIDENNILLVKTAGADAVAIGKSLFEGNIHDKINKLQKSCS